MYYFTSFVARSKLFSISTLSKSLQSLIIKAKESTCQEMPSTKQPLTLDTLNPHIKIMEYAVRGPIVIKAAEIMEELQAGTKKPFTEVIKANIGDCHAMGQVPITFIRQVLALISYPKLLDDPQFPKDVKERAKTLLSACRGGSVGSYTDSSGIELIRRDVAKYIERRDGGVLSDWENVFLSSGASEAIKSLLKLFICDVNNKKTGVMIPIPQYPLYSAAITEYNLAQVGYFLDESRHWGLTTSELDRAINEAKKVCHPRAIVVINPGNPTGQVLSRENIEEVIKFAHKESLFIFADEVYQDNVYAEGCQFHSFKKVMSEMGKPYNELQLASFMSCSKGYMGECGLRGGCVEVVNLSTEVHAMYRKLLTASLCSSSLGQAALDLIVNPPQPGDTSYDQFMQEKCAVLESLKLRAKMVEDTLHSIEGFTCNPIEGAMYAFPQFKLPQKAIEAAIRENKEPDMLYALDLLENTGICIVPGSGFGQQSGTFHFRTTILPQPEKLKVMLEKFKEFHAHFIEKYK